MPRKPKSDDPAESKRFIDMAREIGADESGEGRKAFERAFDRVIERPSFPGSSARRKRPSKAP